MKRLSATLFSAVFACMTLCLQSGYAATWTSPDTVSSTSDNVGSFTVSTNASGASAAAWTNTTDGTVEVSIRDAGISSSWLSTPLVAAPAGDTYSSPQVAINDNGDVLVIWINSNDLTMEANFRPAGGSFSGVTVISPAPSTASPFAPVLVMNDDIAAAVWRRSDGSNFRIETNRFVTATELWDLSSTDAPELLSAAGGSANFPDIAINSRNEIAAIWDRSNGTNTVVQTKMRSASGTWSEAPTIELSDSSQNGSRTLIGIDDAGRMVAAWTWGTASLAQAATFNGAAWSSPVTVSSAGEAVTQKLLAVNANGTAALTWLVNSSDVTQRVVKIAFLKDLPTNSWTSPTTVSTSPGIQTEAPAVGVDQYGNTIVLWNVVYASSSDEQAQSRYYLHEGSSWSASEVVPVSTRNAGVQYSNSPEIGMGSSGNAVAVWLNSVIAGTVRLQASYFANSYPPVQMIAKRRSNRFLSQTDYYNKLAWSNYTSAKPTLYRVTRGTEFLGTISGQDALKFEDHNRNKNVLETYQFSTINTNGGESFPFNFPVTR